MLSPWKVPPQVYNLLQVIRSPEAQICRVLGHPGLPRPPCPDGQAQAGQGDPGSCQPVNVCGEGHSILLSLLIFHSWGLGVPQPPPHPPLVAPPEATHCSHPWSPGAAGARPPSGMEPTPRGASRELGGAPVCTKMNSESGLLVHKGRGAHAPGFRVASGTAFTSPEPASGRRPRPQNPRFYPHVRGLPRRPESAAWLSHHPPPGPCHRRRDR